MRTPQESADLLAHSILVCALNGPAKVDTGNVNLASWVGADTFEWQAVMHFKDREADRLWFCHVDQEWQQSFLLLVACEIFYSV